AMFVIDVPESGFVENTANIRDLEEHDRAAPRRDAADRPGEGGGLADMLHRHLAANEVRRRRVGLAGEKFTDDADIPVLRRQPVGNEARIVADAAVLSGVAEQGEKFALATADLENVLADDAVTPDQFLGELAMKRVKRRREALGFFVLSGIGGAARIPCGVENEAAPRTGRHLDVAGRKPQRFFLRRNQQATIRRHAGDGIEHGAIVRAAIGTGLANHVTSLLDERTMKTVS